VTFPDTAEDSSGRSYSLVGVMKGCKDFPAVYQGVSVHGRYFVSRFNSQGHALDGLHQLNFPVTEVVEDWRL